MNDYVGISVVAVLLYLAYLISKVCCQHQDIIFRINKLLEHQGIDLGKVVEPSAEVKELARTKGAEVEAIKAYREQTGLGLKEARAIVQSLVRARAGDA